MKRIVVAGTGFVGLSTGISFATIGHKVTCVDIDKEKISLLQKGISPIYEPGLQESLLENINLKRIDFTTDYEEAYRNADLIFIAVGTPEMQDGTANLIYLKEVARDIAICIERDIVVVIKSTVPVGTNEMIKQMMVEYAKPHIRIEVVSNPEFLREGSALYDIFNGDRIVIGSDSLNATRLLQDLYKPFNIPIFITNVRSAEMVKYASNAFLATKISFINEISMICEKVDADIEQVALGMGLDHRIGSQFLKAGIGFGGSCFPKDTNALVKESELHGLELKLLKSVIEINEKQQMKLFDLVTNNIGHLKDKKIAILGASFKPNTNDLRHAPSLLLIQQLLKEGVNITAYDPIALPDLYNEFGNLINYTTNLKDAISEKDAALILTEWDEIVHANVAIYERFMKRPIVFDGRNCYNLDHISQTTIHYYSIGRKTINPILQLSH